MSGIGEGGRGTSLVGTVTSGVGLEGCREGKAGGGLFGDVLVVGVTGVLGVLGCGANEVVLHSGDGSLCIKGIDDFIGVPE